MTDTALHEAWRKRLEGFDDSGMTAQRWCDKNGISLDRFYFWRRRFRDATQPPAAQPNGWAVLQIAPSAAPPAAPGAIAVRIGAVSIEVQPGFDPHHLRAVVRALENSPC